MEAALRPLLTRVATPFAQRTCRIRPKSIPPIGRSTYSATQLGSIRGERGRRMTSAAKSTDLDPTPSTPTVDVQGKKFALLSVSDKTGLAELAQGLSELGYHLTSTGGSAGILEARQLPVTKVEHLTSFPEILNGASRTAHPTGVMCETSGRVKTLHPSIHGGILARRDDPVHAQTVERLGIPAIDIVVVNLYPFRQTVLSDPAPPFGEGIENIDIGGPAMIRAAAKNHEYVFVVVDPEDYPKLLQMLRSDAADDAVQHFRRTLAWKAFQHCAAYDAQVSEWMWNQLGNEDPSLAMTVPLKRAHGLRYGENPHQKAAFYTDQSLEKSDVGGVSTAIQHHGKEMSYNNYLDADAAYSCVCDMKDPSCVIVKHTNPCGAATREDLKEAYQLALLSDPISAFGGIVAFNRPVDETLAQYIKDHRDPRDGETKMFYEIVIAPSYSPEGLEILKSKSKNLRILEAKIKTASVGSLRQVSGGFLFQQEDSLTSDDITFTCVSDTQPTEEQLRDLKFAWTCVKHVKSNAITVAKNGQLLGMGSGQPNRVKSVEISLEKAGGDIQGAALASDAFFPFSWGDAVEKACQAGVTSIVHPGGSVRDSDAVDCCNKYGVVLMTTGIRHFRH